jgi:hypothetical protein
MSISEQAQTQLPRLVAIRHYLIAVACGNLLRETAQLPLYTLWRNGPAVLLCPASLNAMPVGVSHVARGKPRAAKCTVC